LATTAFTEALRTYHSRRVHRGPFFTWTAIDKRMIVRMLVFGMKTNLIRVPQLLVAMTVTYILAAVSGPAALAVYARPGALLRHVESVVSKFSIMLSSTAGSLDGLGKQEDIREIFLTGTRSSLAISLPLLLVIALYGDVIIRVWMGEEYVNPVLAPLYAAGMLLPLANSGAMQVLVGLNSHGRVAIASMVACLVAMAIGGAVGFAIGWTPNVAAAVAGASLTLGPGIVVPIAACRRLEVRISEYVSRVFKVPAGCNLVFVAILAIPRLHTPNPSAFESLAAIVAAGCILAALYWAFLLEPQTKQALVDRLRLRFRPA
jgi:O-antigen/teichoic acid export membrane protein